MDEDEKKERCEQAQKRIRAMDEAQARIDALIARAGGPMMICRNTQESDAIKRESRWQMLIDVADYRYEGDLMAYPIELADTIDRLEAALANVINERDQLMADLNRIINIFGVCVFCKHENEEHEKIPECRECSEENDHWEWRGVTEAETDEGTD